MDIVPGHSRIMGYDLARGMAVFAMMIINFSCVFSTFESEPYWLSECVERIEGRAAALFVLLAGIGISLLTRQARQAGTLTVRLKLRRMLCRRAVFLFIAGTCLSITWPGDILHFYGIYLLIAAFLFSASDRVLLVAACLSPLIFLGFFAVVSAGNPGNAYFPTWKTSNEPLALIASSFFNGVYAVFPWITFVLAGMWIGRQNIMDTRLRRKLLVTGAVAAMSAELVSWFLISRPEAGPLTGAPLFSAGLLARGFLGTGMWPPTPFFMLSAGGTALCLLVISLYLSEKVRLKWILPVSNTGRMALSLYVGHVLFGINLLLYLGGSDAESIVFSVGWATAFYIIFIVLCFFWLKRFRTGPLEYVMRRFSSRG